MPVSIRRFALEAAVVPGPEAVGLIVDAEDGLAREHVKTLLVRMDVQRQRTSAGELADTETGVHGAGCVVDE